MTHEKQHSIQDKVYLNDLVMSFGFCNVPATFMRLINDMLRLYIDNFVIIYLDDILIYSLIWDEHLEHVEKVFELLQSHQLCLNEKKYEFEQLSLMYLRFIISNGELKIDPNKMKAIREWFIPSNVTKVKSFMGACQYV
jgi:Reverse transcriptase (RNA-dependent DNA polymerase)